MKKTNPKIKSAYLIGAVPYLFLMKFTLPDDKKRRVITPTYLQYAKFGGEVKTLKDFVLGFVKSLAKVQYFDDNYVGIELVPDSLDISIATEIRCVVKAGKYGLESELRNIKTNSIKRRNKHDCEMIPFVCRFIFNELYSNVILIIEKYGQYSAVGIVFEALDKYLKSEYLNWAPKLEYGPITNLQYIEKQYRQNVKSLHLLTHAIPKDTADKVFDPNSDIKNCLVDIRISAARGETLPVTGFLQRLRSAPQRGALIGGTQYDEVKVELKLGSKTQTVIAGSDSFRVAFDVTDKVELQDDGYPTLKSFIAATEECAKMSKETIQWVDLKEVV